MFKDFHATCLIYKVKKTKIMEFSKRVLLKLKNKNKKLKPETCKKLKRESLRGLLKEDFKRPILPGCRSNQSLHDQIIDDATSNTIISCETLDRDAKLSVSNGRTCEASKLIGEK